MVAKISFLYQPLVSICLLLYIWLLEEANLILAVSASPSSDVCQTPKCFQAATAIVSNMDKTSDPCEDFYQFTCGNWLKRNEISEDEEFVSVDSKIEAERDDTIRVLLEKELTGTEPDFIVKLKALYDSCTDSERREVEGIEPLKKALKKLGGWPVVEGGNWDETSFDWMNTTFRLREMGQNDDTLVTMYVNEDFRNNTVNIIALLQPDLGIPANEYLLGLTNDNIADIYFRLMVAAANWMGANQSTSEQELREAFNFQIMLANFSVQEPMRNRSDMYTTVEQLMTDAPQIDWLRFFNGLLDNGISENATLMNYAPEYTIKFADYITTVNKRVVANYMMWRVVLKSFPYLSCVWKSLPQEYVSAITGQVKDKPLWKSCISTLFSEMGLALNSYYVRNYFKEESKDIASELVEYVRREFKNMLESNEWMDATTKEKAVEKAAAMAAYIGYPKELLNDTLLSALYTDLHMSNGSYYDNTMELNRRSHNKETSRLYKANAKPGWTSHSGAADIYSWYNIMENSIGFPAGVFQLPYFDKDRPYYLNFGGIGSKIGREITHGFDNVGWKYDKNGNNVDWWEPASNQIFEQKAQCFIEQYCNYTVENCDLLNSDAETTALSENIADNGGLKAAYLAYQSWTRVNGTEPLLPGLNFTQNQLFWIGAANILCEKSRPESMKISSLTFPRIPGQFKVIGPMSNLPQFAQDFQCSEGTRMNPTNKCEVW
ncbi:neprilysin-2-like [Stegodyphus dumicola]|uniref:neprilysin-2-like n=1 Tax=Stegodyphus dumicola TaxID=202533 RepID=UPI0015AEFBD4|nr:neprilysin-2-like [Stegodyphus dumicola]